jgi:2-polyprenyl-3-methyl-5-hydroxy-6-metoxy-1,4-benzoquinol methylase
MQINKSAKDIHKSRRKLWDDAIDQHQTYLDENTGIFKEKYVSERVCPACLSNNPRTMFYKSGGSYVCCSDCEMVYLNPAFKDEYLEEYYRSNNDQQGKVVESDLEFYNNLYGKGLFEIANNLGTTGNILDVGCSTGAFLDLASKDGWNCFGLELNQKEIQVALSKGHVVQSSMIDSASFDIKFDAITLWDVFEHIKDGFDFLSHAKRHLSENGVVFIQSPSRDALAPKIMGAACNMFDGLEHVNLYGIDSLVKLCDRSGYEVVSFETVISEIGVVNNYLEYDHPYLGRSNNTETIFEVIDENFIRNNKLGYKFQACLRQR